MSWFSVEMEYALVKAYIDRLILAIIEHLTEIGTLSTGIQNIKVRWYKLLNTKTKHEIKSTDTYRFNKVIKYFMILSCNN